MATKVRRLVYESEGEGFRMTVEFEGVFGVFDMNEVSPQNRSTLKVTGDYISRDSNWMQQKPKSPPRIEDFQIADLSDEDVASFLRKLSDVTD